jgi:NADH-quinone oxidoreductase subunit N
MVMSLAIWIILISLRIKRKNILAIYLTDYSSLFFLNPLLALVFAIILLSMAGIPPLLGFWTKFLVFVSTINSSIYIASICAIFISSFSAFYYLRLVKLLYFNNKYNLLLMNSFNQIPKENSLVLSSCFIMSFVCMFYPNFMLIFANKIVFSLI